MTLLKGVDMAGYDAAFTDADDLADYILALDNWWDGTYIPIIAAADKKVKDKSVALKWLFETVISLRKEGVGLPADYTVAAHLLTDTLDVIAERMGFIEPPPRRGRFDDDDYPPSYGVIGWR